MFYSREVFRSGMLALAVMLAACSVEDPEQTSSDDAVPVRVAEAVERDFSQTRTVSAPIQSYRPVHVPARMQGLLVEVGYEEGDQVQAGAVLARFDVREQRIALQRAETELAAAERAYRRARELRASESISEEAYEDARHRLDRAESDVEDTELRVSYGTVEAPRTGIITERAAEEGHQVSENDRLFTLGDHSRLVTRPGIPEQHVAALAVGQTVSLSVDAHPDASVQGSIRRIFPEADEESGLFTVEIELDQGSTDHTLRPGYLARARLAVTAGERKVAVPQHVVVESNDSTHVFVIREPDDAPYVERQNVITGAIRDGWVAIDEGLESGDQVASGNLSDLEAGRPVRIVGSAGRHGM